MMAGRVPLARRSLFEDRRRAALAAGGIAAALMLVLLLDGIFAGAMRQVTAYLRSSPADVIVSQRGVRTMHMSASALPQDTVAAAGRIPGVAWAEAIRFTTTVVTGSGGEELSYVIGYDPATGRGGPRGLSAGRAPGSGEVLLDEIAAGRIDVGLGDQVGLFGDRFRVSGLFSGGTSIANSTTFLNTGEFARRRGPAVSYVLVGARPGIDPSRLQRVVAAALPATTVQTRAEFTRQEASLVRDMSADLMRIMTIIGFLIALAVVALTLFTLTLSKLREYAVVKALGARTPRLAGVVLAQAAWSVLLALGVAALASVLVGWAVESAKPALVIDVEAGSVIRAGLGALAVGVVGAIVPLRRVVAVDPASAFRRAS
jgi:putative ABC transport system permease protein